MELILLNEKKIKIILTADDLYSMNLTCDKIDYDDTKTRRAIWDIFDKAKEETGFDAASEKVYIQIYPITGGGCEMYVTKIGETASQREPQPDNLLFVFGSFDDLCSALNACECYGYDMEYEIFKNENGAFYLKLRLDDRRFLRYKKIEHIKSLFAEFGYPVDFEHKETYLAAYCTKMNRGTDENN